MNHGRSERAVVERYLDVINRLDIAAFEKIIADDVTIELPFGPPPFPRVVKGRESVVALYRGFPSMLAAPLGLHDIEIRDLTAPGQFVATYRSDGAVLSTGRPHRNSYVGLFTVSDGRLVRFVEYFDPLVLLEAMGADLPVVG